MRSVFSLDRHAVIHRDFFFFKNCHLKKEKLRQLGQRSKSRTSFRWNRGRFKVILGRFPVQQTSSELATAYIAGYG